MQACALCTRDRHYDVINSYSTGISLNAMYKLPQKVSNMKSFIHIALFSLHDFVAVSKYNVNEISIYQERAYRTSSYF